MPKKEIKISMVCLGAHFSAIWIVVANFWMETPGDNKIQHGPNEVDLIPSGKLALPEETPAHAKQLEHSQCRFFHKNFGHHAHGRVDWSAGGGGLNRASTGFPGAW
jgi:hypothetical protein